MKDSPLALLVAYLVKCPQHNTLSLNLSQHLLPEPPVYTTVRQDDCAFRLSGCEAGLSR